MINKQFEAYKILREIKRSGSIYKFKRPKKDDRGQEIIGEYENIKCLCGLYHEENGNVQVVSGDSTITRTKKFPMILCIYEDTDSLKYGDVVAINGNEFKILGIVNIQEWNIVADISLEVFDNGQV